MVALGADVKNALPGVLDWITSRVTSPEETSAS